MDTTLFNYNLDKKYIAKYPAKNRNKSKLLVLNKKTKIIKHEKFNNILNYMKKNDLLILNNTYVSLSKINILYKNKNIKILIEKIITKNEAICICKYIQKTKINKNIKIEKLKNKKYKISTKNITIKKLIKKYGEIPIPIYINRKKQKIDNKRYQTIYGKKVGSIAAPTAGLHFNKKLITDIIKKGIKIGYITLHINSGTFKPIYTNNINKHKMHIEYINVSKNLCKKIEKTKKNKGKIIACGTTTVRAIETAAKNGKITPFEGETNIFIKPGFKFNIIDAIITNFHLPKSTLIILVSAFSDISTIIETYEKAKKLNYRFYSYGDAMFIY